MINKRWFYIHMGEVVTFSKQFDDDLGDIVGFEEGMKARISRVYDDGVQGYSVVFNFSDFGEYNKKLMKDDYLDKKGVACLRWDETSYYPKNCMEEVWFPDEEDVSKYLALVEE